MSQSPSVTQIDIYGVGPDTELITWSSVLGPMYEAMIVVKLTLEDGTCAIGGTTTYTEHQFDRTVLESCSLMAPFVLGRQIADVKAIRQDCMNRYVPNKQVSSSMFDIALYDALGKAANKPIYQLLGAEQEKVRAYASSPLLADVNGYIDYCHEMLNQGYNAIKIHPACVYEQDVELVNALAEEFERDNIGWSLDVDSNYTLEQALEMGKLLDKYQWDFFEEPISDARFDDYAYLKTQLNIDLVAGGNTILDLNLIDHALNMGCWDRGRFDVTGLGFTDGSKAMALFNQRQIKTEIQSWGYTLTQAANLHMMLAHKNCEYFEQAAPFEKYEFAAKQVIRPDSQGFVRVSDLPGLGVELDWSEIDSALYSHRQFTL